VEVMIIFIIINKSLDKLSPRSLAKSGHTYKLSTNKVLTSVKFKLLHNHKFNIYQLDLKDNGSKDLGLNMI